MFDSLLIAKKHCFSSRFLLTSNDIPKKPRKKRIFLQFLMILFGSRVSLSLFLAYYLFTSQPRTVLWWT
jgi:hypothetical protein